VGRFAAVERLAVRGTVPFDHGRAFLAAQKRAIWRKVFEHHVFESDGDPVAHLPANRRGIQGRLDQRIAEHIRAWLLQALSRRRW
jgi:hypothetical protein